MRVVLDTSVVIAPAVQRHGDEVGVSSATLAELHFGVLLARSPEARAERLRRLTDVERRFEVLGIDGAVAQAYGQLAARVVQLGRQPRRRSMDLLIAATAVVHDAALMTRNPDDLSGLDDLVRVIAVD